MAGPAGGPWPTPARILLGGSASGWGFKWSSTDRCCRYHKPLMILSSFFLHPSQNNVPSPRVVRATPSPHRRQIPQCATSQCLAVTVCEVDNIMRLSLTLCEFVSLSRVAARRIAKRFARQQDTRWCGPSARVPPRSSAGFQTRTLSHSSPLSPP